MKLLKKRNLKLAALSLVGLAVLSVGFPFLSRALGESAKVIVQGDYIEAASNSSQADVSDSLGGLPNQVTDVNFVGKVTLQDVAYGTKFKIPLNFAAAATTTPGKLFKVQNTGTTDRICTNVVLDIKTGSSVSGPADSGLAFSFSVATSTSDFAWSTKNGSLIASTTPATSSAPLINSVQNVGSYVGADQDVGGTPWVWSAGTYVLGAFDDAVLSGGGASLATSSAPYGTMTGNAYISCILR